jgi:VanZ family protein
MSSNGSIAVRESPSQVELVRLRRQRNRKGAGFWISAWLPVVIGIGVIVLESTAWFGADRTSRPLRIAFEAVFGPVSDARWDVFHHYIRKAGHFTGYGLIGVAWLRAWWMTLPRSRFFSDVGLALLGTGLLATWDEWHQSFLPNRTSSPWDVLIDCTGAICLLLATYFFVKLFRPERLARQ